MLRGTSNITSISDERLGGERGRATSGGGKGKKEEETYKRITFRSPRGLPFVDAHPMRMIDDLDDV